MREGAGSVAPWREDVAGFTLTPRPTDQDKRIHTPVVDRDVGIVPFLVGRGYSLRSIARAHRTRSFGCISLLELEGA